MDNVRAINARGLSYTLDRRRGINKHGCNEVGWINCLGARSGSKKFKMFPRIIDKTSYSVVVGCIHPTVHVTVVAFVLIQALFAQTVALCPSRCHCNEDSLGVTCTDSGLDLVPILLNPEIIELNLSHNKITNLHYTLSFYNNLEGLDLSYNKIETLGSMNFESQHNLIHLNLSNNFVQNVSRDTFKGLKKLQVLDVSYNKITNIVGNAFNDFKALHTLQLNNNLLISFEQNLFQHLLKLNILNLSFNQLLEIPTNILICTKELRRLQLSHNLIEEIEDFAIQHPFLELLWLDSNLISNISLNAFEELPAMQLLDLSDNNLFEVPTQQMSKLTNLSILKLSGNNIQIIQPLAFRSLFQLKTIYLNRLTRMTQIDSRAFVDNINLQTVFIDSNPQLQLLPTRMFHGMHNVQHLSIRNSVIQTLAPDHFPLDQMRSLQLSGDNFICNCSLYWLWKLVKENPPLNNSSNQQFHLDANGVKCLFPPQSIPVHLKNVPESDITCSSQWITTITGTFQLPIKISQGVC